MLGSILKALKTIVSKPIVLIPAILIAIISHVIFIYNTWIFERIFTDYVLYNPQLTGADPFTVILTQYPLEFAVAILWSLVVMTISLTGILAVARIAKGEKFVKAVNDSMIQWKKSLALTVFIFLGYFILYTIITFLTSIITNFFINTGETMLLLVSFIWAVILLIIVFTIGTRVIFIIPALIENNPKQAIKKSWNFTKDNFWSSFILLIITAIISEIIIYIIGSIGVMFELYILDEIANIIVLTFFVLAISYHYFE